jgi:hypothetical protein
VCRFGKINPELFEGNVQSPDGRKKLIIVRGENVMYVVNGKSGQRDALQEIKKK